MNKDILAYNNSQSSPEKEICNLLTQEISTHLPEAENKIWHAHPVWFLDGNPIVGYSKQKAGWRLMFWSGASFEEEKLNVLYFLHCSGTNQYKRSGTLVEKIQEYPVGLQEHCKKKRRVGEAKIASTQTKFLLTTIHL
jgi:hypothetical protein